MRVFWIIVALLAVIALGALTLSSDDNPSASTSDAREVAMAPESITQGDAADELRPSINVAQPAPPAAVDDQNTETDDATDQQANDTSEPAQVETIDAADTDADSEITPDDTTGDPALDQIVVDPSSSDPIDDAAQDVDDTDVDYDETTEPATATEAEAELTEAELTEAVVTDSSTEENASDDDKTTGDVDESPAQAPPNDDAATELVEELLTSAQQREAESNGESLDDVLDDTPRDVEPAPAEANEAPAAAKVEHTIVTREDGSMLVDDRFIVRGTGAQDDPYVVSWEMLVSAYETYQPREGQTDIPERIAMLHDAYVKVTGYLAFPMAGGEISEALVMLNAWDGCCIGVPPSPYDSIEVRLAEPANLDGGEVTPYGTIEGVFKVDPYLVNKWLVGLYLFEDATLDMGL